jgi:hypothetical protein
VSNTSGLNLFDSAFASFNQTTRVVSASTTKAGAVFVAPKAGNISAVGFPCTAVAGSPALDVRLEGVTAGLPSGTLAGTNTNATYSPTLTNTFVWTTLTAALAVSAGDLFAAAIAYISGTSATVSYANGGYGAGIPSGLPYPVVQPTGTWATSGHYPMVAVKYDDGTIIRGCVPASQITNSNLQSGTNPNERATRFTAPVGSTLLGVRIMLSIGTTSAYSLNLYSGTNTSPVSGGTITVAAGRGVTSTPSMVVLHFAAPLTLTAGQQYALSVLATAAVNVSCYRFLFPSTAERNMVMGEASSDTRNGSSWIGEVTTTSEQIWPLFGSLTGGGRRSRLRAA